MSKRRITLEDLYDGLQALNTKVNGLTIKVDNLIVRVDDLTEKVYDLTERVDSLETKVGSLEDSHQTLAGMVSNLAVEQKSFRYTLDNLTAGYVDFRSEFKKLRDITSSGFDTMNDRFDRVEDRVGQLEVMMA